MTERAFLVGELDLRARPPRLVHVGIYNRSARELLPEPLWMRYRFDLYMAEADNYWLAVRNLVKVRSTPEAWAIAHMSEEDRQRIGL